MTRVARRLIVLCMVIATAATAGAQQAEASWGASTGLAVGANPLVVGATGSATRTIPLYPQRSGVLWDNARVELGAQLLANPSFTDLAARVYFEPIAPFDLTLRSGVRTFYNALDLGAAPLSGYDASPPSAAGDDYNGQNETGWFFGVAPRLKAAAGPVIVTNTFTATWYDFSGSDTAFLEEPLTITAASRTDWVLENEAQLLYRFREVDASFLASGVTHRSAWVPSADQPVSQRSALLGVYVAELTPRTSLQSVLFLGAYINGEPIDTDRPFVLAALTLISRLD